MTNRPDGAVETVFEGAADAVAAMVSFCEEGPRGAEVERVEVTEEETEGLGDFRIT